MQTTAMKDEVYIREAFPEIDIIYNFLNGKQVVYTNQTVFRVQWGRNKKAKYETMRTFTGNLMQAVEWYNALNIRYPFKKRLYSESMNPHVLDRQWASGYE